jgi:YfiH family protein
MRPVTALPESAVLRPAWTVPARVRALMSTREGGVGVAPFDTLNLASDERDPAVAENRRRFAATLGATPRWLHQVHGATVVRLDGLAWSQPPQADASICTVPGVACAVFAADCLPVLFCAADGQAVGAAHAGWRGLAAGVLEATVGALCEAAGCAPAQVRAWLGPCIGPRRFEVGADVLRAFAQDPAAPDAAVFVRRDRADRGTGDGARWLAHLPELARRRLRALGLRDISGGLWCTVEDARFFSYRRDSRGGAGVPGVNTGRMAAAIALVDRA